MKLLVLCWNYATKEKPHIMAYVHNRCKIYQRHKHEVLIFVPSENKSCTYTYDGVRVLKQPFANIKNVVDIFDPDAVILHAPSGWWLKYFFIAKSPKAWVTFMQELQRPIVTWIHGSETLIRAFHDFFSSSWLRANFNRIVSIPVDVVKCMLLRHVLSLSTAVVYVANWTMKMSQKYTNFKHPYTFVVPNPVDTVLFCPQKISPKNAYKALSIRSMEWRYGLDVAVKAFAYSKHITLTILGRGSMEKYLKFLAEKYRAPVKFITNYVRREEMPKFIAQHGVFIAPSRQESQGVAMCEAMAVGLPVIATRVCGIPEFVHNGYNGFLVPPNNPLAIRKAVLRLVNDSGLYEEMSKNAVNFVRENLSQDVIYEKEYKILKMACDIY